MEFEEYPSIVQAKALSASKFYGLKSEDLGNNLMKVSCVEIPEVSHEGVVGSDELDVIFEKTFMNKLLAHLASLINDNKPIPESKNPNIDPAVNKLLVMDPIKADLSMKTSSELAAIGKVLNMHPEKVLILAFSMLQLYCYSLERGGKVGALIPVEDGETFLEIDHTKLMSNLSQNPDDAEVLSPLEFNPEETN